MRCLCVALTLVLAGGRSHEAPDRPASARAKHQAAKLCSRAEEIFNFTTADGGRAADRAWARHSPELRLDLCASHDAGVGARPLVRRWGLVHGEHDELVCGPRAPPRETEKLAYFVRHAEGWHNRLRDFGGAFILDPILTSEGVAQASGLPHDPELALALGGPSTRVQAIIASPMRRTMATAVLGFNASLPPPGVLWELDPDIQETSAFPSDTGNRQAGNEALRKLGRLDLLEQYKNLPEEWIHKEGKYAPDPTSVRARFRDFTARLWQRPERRFLVVAHGAVLSLGLGTWDEDDFLEGPMFANAEVQPYALTLDGVWRALEAPHCWPGGAAASVGTKAVGLPV